MKPNECEGCPLIACEGPVPGELNGKADWNLEGTTDVLFVSEAPGRVEIEQMRPFANPRGAGGILRQALKYDVIEDFGILNVWRCRPPNNKLPETGEPGAFCKQLLKDEIHRWSPKVVVPLGAVGLNALTTQEMSITSARGRLFTIDGLVVLPMLHPAFLMRKRALWRDWELDNEKLVRFLAGKTDYIALEDQHIRWAQSIDEATQMLDDLCKYPKLSCDIETASYNMPWQHGELLSIAFAWAPRESYVFPWKLIASGRNYDLLRTLMENDRIKFWWYNGVYDVQHVWAAGIKARIDGDAMLEVHLHDERLDVHALKKDSGIYLDALDWEAPIKRYNIPKDISPEAQQAWRDIPVTELSTYNGYDTTHTLHLSDVVRERIGEGLRKYADDLLVPAYNMLARARYVGIRMDVYRIGELRDVFVPVLQELEHRLVEISGDSFFNPRSPQQKLAMLHKRKIMVPDTRKETLEEYIGDEAVDAIRAYSDAHKMQSTYIEGIVEDISDDMRVHPDWRLPTETGRLRSSDPNILGMPRKAEEQEHKWKRRIKEMFIADKGKLLAHPDRRQSEFRCCLYLANEQDFIKFLIENPDADIHGEFALKIYGSGYTKEQRVYAKMVVFGLQNNREAPSIARQFTAIEREKARKAGSKSYRVWRVSEAQRFINDFFARIPNVVAWKKAVMAEAMENWQLTSLLGRVRRFGFVTYENKKEVMNEAVNFPISSLSNDINLISCVETMKHFGKYGVEILAPIHDSALMLVPDMSVLSDIEALWESIPGRLLNTNLPFPVDMTVGERWSDL